jgi:hypothetical protein
MRFYGIDARSTVGSTPMNDCASDVGAYIDNSLN